MKKIGFILLALCVMGAVMSGCSKPADDTTKTDTTKTDTTKTDTKTTP